MELLLEASAKQAYEGLFGEVFKSYANPSFGEAIPLSVALLKRISEPETKRIFDPQSLTGWTIRAAIGKSFQLPLAGSFTITYGANTTTALSYNPTAAEINTAFNALASVTADGGAVVTGQDGYFFFTWNTNGDRAEISADITNLAPLSIGEVGTLIDGSAARREVQTFRLIQNPGAYAVLSDVSNAPGAPVTVLQVGGGGFNHRIRVKLTPVPFDGKWSIRIGLLESGLLAYNITEAALQTALEAMSTVGAGNVIVYKEEEASYLIAFEGAHADEDMGEITTNATGLKVIDYRSGVLDLRTPGIELLLAGQSQVDCHFEIEGTPPTGYPQKLYKVPVTVVSAVIDPAALTPQPRVLFYTAAEVDAFFSGPNWRRKAATGHLQIKGVPSGLYYNVWIDTTSGTAVWQVDPAGEA